jgi:hypothetical protein
MGVDTCWKFNIDAATCKTILMGVKQVGATDEGPFLQQILVVQRSVRRA